MLSSAASENVLDNNSSMYTINLDLNLQVYTIPSTQTVWCIGAPRKVSLPSIDLEYE